jgi:hypothetical protein
VGIPKKTLNDYNKVLRVAHELGFDFKRSAEAKMGCLRKLTKDAIGQEKEKRKH